MEGELIGNPEMTVSGVAPIGAAQAGDITFLSGAKNYSRHLEDLKMSRAAAVIAPADAPELSIPNIRLKNSYYGLVKALEFFYPDERPVYKIHPTAFVSEDAEVAEDAIIGPNAVVESGAKVSAGAWIESQALVSRGAIIGAKTRIHPGVRILSNTVVGSNCIINAGSIIGSDGFGFTEHEGKQIKVPQVGNVVIEDEVEIGASVTIDRATMGSTLVGSGTKIDNMVHIAHNCVIGKNCTIVAQVGISGSTILEDNVTMAGQTGTVGHVRVGRDSVVAARGVVTNDVEPGSFVSGFPMKPHQEERRILASMRKLPEMLKKVRKLEKLLAEKEK